MTNLTITRTYVGTIQNHRQVYDDPDSLGDAAPQLENVVRWTAGRILDETGKITDDGELKAYLKTKDYRSDLNAAQNIRQRGGEPCTA